MDAFRVELLIFGYIRQQEKELDLYMNIPIGINKIIHDLYPVLLFTFGDHNEKALLLDNDRTIIKGNDPVSNSCSGYLVYADSSQYSNTGFNKGIHLWSIKSLLTQRYGDLWSGCYASIGVTTQKNDKLINKCHHGKIKIGYNSWYQTLNDFDLSHDVIVTIKLNCNDWTVTYYKDKEEYMLF